MFQTTGRDSLNLTKLVQGFGYRLLFGVIDIGVDPSLALAQQIQHHGSFAERPAGGKR